MRLGFGPQDWDLGPKNGILDLRGMEKKKEKEKEEKKEKIPHMCESIGHRSLRGRCPKGDRPTDRPTDQPTNRRTDLPG